MAHGKWTPWWLTDIDGGAVPALKGYNALTWTSGGMTYWAVSDLNAAELSELQKAPVGFRRYLLRSWYSDPNGEQRCLRRKS